MRIWLCCIIMSVSGFALAQKRVGPELARRGGPSPPQTRRLPDISSFDLVSRMFRSMETNWAPAAYESAVGLSYRMNVSAGLPGGDLDRRLGDETINFDLDIDGVATPNGRYKMDIGGDFGDVTLVHDLRRRFLSSPAFKAFSDTPVRTRSPNANLTNYRSYMLRYLNKAKSAVLEGGHYRHVYAGTGLYDGGKVHVLRIYKPNLRKRDKGRKPPMPLRKLWTFWQEGGYELWLDTRTYLPVVVFYTNMDDNVFANFEIQYDDDLLPKRISFTNNSLKSEGEGDVVLTFDPQKRLSGVSLKFDGERGISLQLDTVLAFDATLDEGDFRVLPPFGFRKINSDHLKLMVMTQLSGGLLKLKKHGVNFKNFKF